MEIDQRIGMTMHTLLMAIEELASLQRQNPWRVEQESQWLAELHQSLGALVYKLPFHKEDIISHHWETRTGEIETSSTQSLEDAQEDIDDYSASFLRAGMKYLCTTVTTAKTAVRSDWSQQVIEAAGSENVVQFLKEVK